MAPRSKKADKRPRADLTLKISLAGDPGVGKTSLTRRFVSDTFDEKYVSTLGTKVSSKDFSIEDPTKPGATVNIAAAIWDIMGNHQFRELLKDAFFMNASGALLVCDVSRPDTLYNLPGWYETVASVAGPIPAIVLANKSDLRGPQAIPASEIDLICKRLGWPWFEASAKTGENVEAAFHRLAEEYLRAVNRPNDATPAAA